MRGWLCMAALVPALSDELGSLLADPAAVDAFRRGCARDEVRAVALMAQQSVRSGIDYASLGQGWSHPQTRTAYREAKHASFTVEASRRRQRGSADRLLALVRQLGAGDRGGAGGRAPRSRAFVARSANGDAPAADFGACSPRSRASSCRCAAQRGAAEHAPHVQRRARARARGRRGGAR